MLFPQLHKVNEFYFERIYELNSRLKVLVEGVVEEYGAQGGTPAMHRRKQSLAERMVSRIQRAVHHERGSSLPDASAYMVKPVHIPHESSTSDDPFMEDHGMGEDYSDKFKASDSIQRDMTDMYRTAKLLHNYAIMNYTGFVKIVKKHDKAFKEYKGKYTRFTIESEVCNGGKDVAKLEDRMVRYVRISNVKALT